MPSGGLLHRGILVALIGGIGPPPKLLSWFRGCDGGAVNECVVFGRCSVAGRLAAFYQIRWWWLIEWSNWLFEQGECTTIGVDSGLILRFKSWELYMWEIFLGRAKGREWKKEKRKCARVFGFRKKLSTFENHPGTQSPDRITVIHLTWHVQTQKVNHELPILGKLLSFS